MAGLLFGNDAFVSYKFREGERYVSALMESLSQRNLLPKALTESTYTSDSEVEGKIRSALERCRVVILVASEEALKSNWITFEIGTALSFKKRLLPIAIGEIRDPLHRTESVQLIDELLWLNDSREAFFGREALRGCVVSRCRGFRVPASE